LKTNTNNKKDDGFNDIPQTYPLPDNAISNHPTSLKKYVCCV
jgi:hypothetical protein